MIPFVDRSCAQFAENLASKDAVPGGGGAAALVGALGAALASMVSNLTIGKKKYAAYEDDVRRILEKADNLRQELLALIDRDAEAFEPLSRAYSIPKDDPQREQIMEEALQLACTAPMDIMRAAAAVTEMLMDLVEKGSSLAVSDAGCAAVCCKAAVQSASLSVYINTKSMKDRERAAEIECEAEELIARCSALADQAYAEVLKKLR